MVCLGGHDMVRGNPLQNRCWWKGVLVAVAVSGLGARGQAQSAAAYTFTTPVGVSSAGLDGPVGTAALGRPAGVALDAEGNVFVADSSAHVIRRITPAGRVETWVGEAGQRGQAAGTAGAARLNRPVGLAAAGDGTLWFTSDGGVWTVTADRRVSRVSTTFSESGAIAVARDGVVFVADAFRIQAIAPSGAVTTLAGGVSEGYVDGAGTAARFGVVSGLAVASTGDVLVAERVQVSGAVCCGRRIRRVTREGAVTTVAGSGEATLSDGATSTAGLPEPGGIAAGPDGTIRFTDAGGTVRSVSSGVVQTIAAATAGTTPRWIATASDGTSVVTSPDGHVTRIGSGGTVATIMPAAPVANADGTGSRARLTAPSGVAFAPDGIVYVADFSGHRIRTVSPSGAVSTLDMSVAFPSGIAVDEDGAVYVADSGNGRVVRRRPDGGVDTAFVSTVAMPIRSVAVRAGRLYVLAGHGVVTVDTQTLEVLEVIGSLTDSGSSDGVRASARFSSPGGIAVDGFGRVLVADSGNHVIRQVSADGTVSTLAGAAGIIGSVDAVGSSARFHFPRGIAVSASGAVMVSDTNNHTIRMIDTALSVTTIAGVSGMTGTSDGVAGESLFALPWGVAISNGGSVWVADFNNATVRRGDSGATVSPLSVVTPPMTTTASEGTDASFHFVTSGVPSARTRWQFSFAAGGTWHELTGDGDAIGGSTTARLTVRASEAVHGRWYRAIASNGPHTLVSDGAQLLVSAVPTIGSGPVDQVTVPGVATSFVVSGVSTSASIQWQRSLDGGTTFDNIADDAEHAGSTTSWLLVTPPSIVRHGARYRAVASNRAGVAMSQSATLSVVDVRVTVDPVSTTVRAGQPATFSAAAIGAGVAYQWQESAAIGSEFVDLPNAGPYTGTTTSQLRIDPAHAGLHGRRYRVRARSGGASAASAAAVLWAATTQLVVTPSVLRFHVVKAGATGAVIQQSAAQSVEVAYTGNVAPVWSATSSSTWAYLDVLGAAGKVCCVAPSVTGARRVPVTVNNTGNVIAGASSLETTITVEATNIPGLSTTLTVHLTIDQSGGATTRPFGSLDSPVTGSGGHAGAVGVTGWALDDLGVNRVEIWRQCDNVIDRPRAACGSPDGVEPPDSVYVGRALFVDGARPDVQALYSTLPQASRAGWGLLVLTNMLPHFANGTPAGGQGTFTFSAWAVDVEGQRARIGSTTINVDNDGATAPFGAVDSPEAGDLVTSAPSGLLTYGWAMARGGRCLDVTSRSTWRVYLDGVLLTAAQAAGNGGHARPDVAASFPGACHGETSGASFVVAASLLTNGQHTLSWEAVDPLGTVGAFGSRFFHVLLPGADRAGHDPVAPGLPDAARATRTSGFRNDVRVRQADDGSSWIVVEADSLGGRRLEMRAGGRLHLDLGGPVTGGHQRVGVQVFDLPGGSRVQTDEGVFTWEPPLGYSGQFELVFETGPGPIVVIVTIR
jgi:sugar lactone lactonase YvrE